MKINKKQEILDYVLKKLAAGELVSGEQILTEPELAGKFSTSIATAHRAIKDLEKAKIVARIKGKGTFILDNADVSTFDRFKYEQEKKIHVILPLSNSLHVHWSETTLHALEAALKDAGYKIFYFEYDDMKGSPEEFNAIIQAIIPTGSNGIVVSTFNNISNILGENSHLLLDNQVPLFIHNRTGEYVPDLLCNMISQDPYSDGVTIGKLIAEKNYSEVTFINSSDYQHEKYSAADFWLQIRIRGIKFGLNTKNTNIRFNVINSHTEYDAVCTRLRNRPRSICLVSVNAKVGAKFIEFSTGKKIKIPDDFELIAFDDNPKFFKYNITSLAAPLSKIGTLLGQMICNADSSVLHNCHSWIKVPYELKERQSFVVLNNNKKL